MGFVLGLIMRDDWVVVGLAGATCSGKTTLAKSLKDSFPGSILLHQDDFFLDVASDKHTIVPQLNHINFEILSSLDNDAFLDSVTKVLEESFTENPKTKLLIIEGFLVLNEVRLAALCDIKIYVTLSHDECWARRSIRTYDPPDPPGYFDLCVWPSYEMHRNEVLARENDLVLLDGKNSKEQLLDKAFAEISSFISKFK